MGQYIVCMHVPRCVTILTMPSLYVLQTLHPFPPVSGMTSSGKGQLVLPTYQLKVIATIPTSVSYAVQ